MNARRPLPAGEPWLEDLYPEVLTCQTCHEVMGAKAADSDDPTGELCDACYLGWLVGCTRDPDGPFTPESDWLLAELDRIGKPLPTIENGVPLVW